MSKEESETARNMTLMGLWCIQTDPSQRPLMNKVMDMLEGKCRSPGNTSETLLMFSGMINNVYYIHIERKYVDDAFL